MPQAPLVLGALVSLGLLPREQAAERCDSHCIECIFCQEPMQLGKRGSLLRFPAPALKHQLIQALWAGRWPEQVHLYCGNMDDRQGRGSSSLQDDMCCPSQSSPPPLQSISPPSSLTCRPWSRKNSPAFSMTCSSVSCPKGWALQSISTSHRVTPKAQTSLAVVNFPWHKERATKAEKGTRQVSCAEACSHQFDSSQP